MNKNLHSLAVHQYPCSQQPLTDDIVLLHGWGSGSNSWSPLLPALQNIANVIALDLPGFGDSNEIPNFSAEKVIDLIADCLPDKCVVIGWSLGGMLAVKIAEKYPQKVSNVITLAANVKFVASKDFETAMPLSVNRHFNKSFAADPQSTLKFFTGLLAQGGANERALLKQVRSLAVPDKINPNWLQALDVLASLDNREAFTNLRQPGLHLLAEKDALVPVAAEKKFTLLNSKQTTTIIPNAAHALHWSEPELVAKLITEFLLHASHPVTNKKQMAHSFSRAAPTYDSVASLQRDVGETLLEKLGINSDVNVVVDLGCGTGHFTPRLQSLFPNSVVVGVDIAEGMLHFSRAHHVQQKNWLCADAESLAFASNSVDLIYSNFALQWCSNLPDLFSEMNRVLKSGGQCTFTTLGPQTLHELKSAWQQVDEQVHVNQFHEPEVLLESLRLHGLQLVEFSRKSEVMEFENLSDLTRSLKSLGAHNVNHGRASGLTGRKKMQAFKQAYENFRRNNLLPATYDVFYLIVKNP